jgi:hypothetical protein
LHLVPPELVEEDDRLPLYHLQGVLLVVLHQDLHLETVFEGGQVVSEGTSGVQRRLFVKPPVDELVEALGEIAVEFVTEVAQAGGLVEGPPLVSSHHAFEFDHFITEESSCHDAHLCQ